jgi:hypothetical protein
MTGSDLLLTHVPELRFRSRRVFAALIALASFAVATTAMIIVDWRHPLVRCVGNVRSHTECRRSVW